MRRFTLLGITVSIFAVCTSMVAWSDQSSVRKTPHPIAIDIKCKTGKVDVHINDWVATIKNQTEEGSFDVRDSDVSPISIVIRPVSTKVGAKKRGSTKRTTTLKLTAKAPRAALPDLPLGTYKYDVEFTCDARSVKIDPILIIE